MANDELQSKNILISNFGSLGDVLPLLDLGKDLRARGHAVTFATTANLRNLVEESGLSFHAIGTAERMEALHADPALWEPKRGLKLMFDLAVDLMQESRRITEEELRRSVVERVPFVAVGGMLSFGLRVARERHRFPLVTLFLAPFLMRSRIAPPVLPGLPLPSWLPGPVTHRIQRLAERFIVDPERLPALNAIRAELDLAPIRNLSDWLPSPDRLCLMTPPWFAPPQPDWLAQTRQTGFPRVTTRTVTGPLSAGLVEFLQAGDKPVIATYGSTMRHGRAFFEAASRACAQAGRRAVLVTGDADLVSGHRRPDQFVVAKAPFEDLLPRACALIHHGGIGTCFEAFDAGIPQIVIPNAFDQMDNAARIASLGLGLRLSHGAFARRGGATLARMLSDGPTLRRCAEASRLCAQEDGIAQASTLVEAMAGPSRRRMAEPLLDMSAALR